MNTKERWDELVEKLSKKFSKGEDINVEGILYLIGLQEIGNPLRRFRKDDKMNLIHVGICKVLEPHGYYRFEYFDEDGWPHFKLLEPLPNLKAGEQSILIKSAIVEYFSNKEILT